MLLSIKVFYRFSTSYKAGQICRRCFCLNTTQLECFIAVANCLNFSRAAEQLRLTQPAVSHQISSLEDELGVKLFKRTSKSVRLTREGNLYTQYAGEILRLFNVSRGRVRAIGEEQRRVLGIGCRNTLELRLLSGALAELREEDGNFIPSLRVVPHDSLENLLLDGEIQVMPTFKENAPKRAVYRELALCRVVCALPEDSPLAERGSLEVQDIAQSCFLAISRPNASPRAVIDVQNRLIAGRGPGSVIFCESIEAQSAVIAAGFAVSVLAETPGIQMDGVCYVPVAGTEPISYGAAYMPDSRDALLNRFLGLLAEISKRE